MPVAKHTPQYLSDPLPLSMDRNCSPEEAKPSSLTSTWESGFVALDEATKELLDKAAATPIPNQVASLAHQVHFLQFTSLPSIEEKVEQLENISLTSLHARLSLLQGYLPSPWMALCWRYPSK